MSDEMEILFDHEFGTVGMEDDANDWDDYDPNRCPACGADVVFGACIDPQCMWTPEDDADDETEVDHD